MIECYFEWIPGIGNATQKKLWDEGFVDYTSIFKCQPRCLSSKMHQKALSSIQELKLARDEKKLSWINKNLPSNLHWAFIPDYLDTIAYLDIETTGLHKHRHYITTIAVYDGKQVYDFVNGDNLQDFPDFISKFEAIATYNRKTFDLPFMEYEFNFFTTKVNVFKETGDGKV